MGEAAMFRGAALDLAVAGGSGGKVVALVNAARSSGLGGGIGAFENCCIPWTVTHDEILYGLEGTLEIHIGDEVHEMGPGDAMWLPAGTELAYVAGRRAKFFFAVAPVTASKAGSDTTLHPPVPPRRRTASGRGNPVG